MSGWFITSQTATQLTSGGSVLLGHRWPAGLKFIDTESSLDKYVPSPNRLVYHKLGYLAIMNNILSECNTNVNSYAVSLFIKRYARCLQGQL